MKLSLTTSKKIWLSVAILLIGYCISMAFGILLGQKNLHQVQRVANDWYPAAKQIQQAASYFNGQIDLYNDALSLQDSGFLALAETEAEKVHASLKVILTSHSFEPQQLAVTTALQADLQEFSRQAATAYSKAIQILNGQEAGENDPLLQTHLVEFAQQSEELHDRLELEAQHFSTLLHEELLDVSSDLKREQYLNVAVFLMVTIVALTAIQIILTRSTREILDRDDALDRVLSGEVEFGEAFFSVNSMSAQIVEEAESTAERSSDSVKMAQKTVGQLNTIGTAMQKLTTNVRELSAKTAWFLERVPDFGAVLKKASGSMRSLDRELREIRNLGLVLAELGDRLKELTDSPEFPNADSLQMSSLRVGEFAEAILERLNVIQQGIAANGEAVSQVEAQGMKLEGLGEAMKTTLDNQVLETHHMSLLIETLGQEAGGLQDTLTTIHTQTSHISQAGRLAQHEMQKLLPMVTQLHERIKTAKFKQQTLRKHHVSSISDPKINS